MTIHHERILPDPAEIEPAIFLSQADTQLTEPQSLATRLLYFDHVKNIRLAVRQALVNFTECLSEEIPISKIKALRKGAQFTSTRP